MSTTKPSPNVVSSELLLAYGMELLKKSANSFQLMSNRRCLLPVLRKQLGEDTINELHKTMQITCHAIHRLEELAALIKESESSTAQLQSLYAEATDSFKSIQDNLNQNPLLSAWDNYVQQEVGTIEITLNDVDESLAIRPK